MFFQFVPGDFSYLTNQNNQDSNWKKILGFRNMQEKLENAQIYIPTLGGFIRIWKKFYACVNLFFPVFIPQIKVGIWWTNILVYSANSNILYQLLSERKKNVMQTKALFLFNLLMCVAQMHPLFSGLSFVYKIISKTTKRYKKRILERLGIQTSSQFVKI